MKIIVSIEGFFGIERLEGNNVLIHYFKDNNILKNFGSTLDFISGTLSMTLMTVFFLLFYCFQNQSTLFSWLVQ